MASFDMNTTTTGYTKNFCDVVQFFSYQRKVFSYRFPTLYTEKYFKWKIADNPFGHSVCYLRKQDGIPAAHSSITAKPINPHFGVGTGCGELGDSNTHPSYRKQGHFGAVGQCAIQSMDILPPAGTRLIYGLPNEQAVPGWLRHCHCEIFAGFNMVEWYREADITPFNLTKDTFSLILNKPQRPSKHFRLCTHHIEMVEDINRLWLETVDKDRYLINKDGAWWRWRYQQATEHYTTYGWWDQYTKKLLGYIVLKIGWFGLRYVQICDIFAVNSERIAEMFRLLMRDMILPTDRVLIWAQPNTALGAAVHEEGFAKKRDITIVFYRNEAYSRLRQRNAVMSFALGDSDNV